MVIITHVPKCVGTSLREMLVDALAIPEAMQYRPRGGMSSITLHHPHDFRCLIGHYPWGVHWLLRPWSSAARRPKLQIATLRDPVDQMLSFYYYHVQLGERSPYRDAIDKTSSAVEFYEKTASARNLQTRMYAGVAAHRAWSLYERLMSSDALVELAARHLIEHYHYWIHHSFLEQSVQYLSRGIGVSLELPVVGLTVTKKRKTLAALSSDERAELGRLNALDMALHRRIDEGLRTHAGVHVRTARAAPAEAHGS